MDITKMKSYKDTKPFKVDRNGTQYFYDWTCKRCGGAGGANMWQYTGWTCYDCGGTGRARKPEVWKVYTPEHEAKLAAQRKARQEKRDAERRAQAEEKNRTYFERRGFDESGRTWVYTGDTFAKREELKEAGAKYDGILGWHSASKIEAYPAVQFAPEFQKDNCGVIIGFTRYDSEVIADRQKLVEEAEAKANPSEHVGNIGDKVEFSGTYVKHAWYERPKYMGYGTETVWIHTISDEHGNIFVWKTKNALCGFKDGDKVSVRGTVKEHTEYKGIKQTVLQRCNIKEG